MTYWFSKVQTIACLNVFSVVSNPDVEMEVSHEEEKVKDAPLVSELSWYRVSLLNHFVYRVSVVIVVWYIVVYVCHIHALYDVGSYTRFQCYVHRRHLRSSFDMPSFDMLFKRLFNC